MSDVTTTAGPNAIVQDRWISAFTGLSVDRSAPKPQTTWQTATPSTKKESTNDFGSAKAAEEKAKQELNRLTLLRQNELIEVDAALNPAKEACDTVHPSARGTLDQQLADMVRRRDTLAGAADAESLKTELLASGALLADIKRTAIAVGQAKDAWDKLTEARKAKLVEADAVLKQANEAAALLVSPIPRDTVDPLLADVTRRRDALAGAVEMATVQAEIDNAPQLVTDIGKAKDAAAKVKLDWDKLGEARKAKLIEVDAALKQANEAAALLVSPIPRDTVDPLLTDVARRREALANATDMPTIRAETDKAPQLVTDIGKAKDAAAKAKLDWDTAVSNWQAKLNEIDLALADVSNVASGITLAQAKDPIDAALVLLNGRRTSFADAKTAPEIATQMSGAAQLLSDVAQAKNDALQAESDALALDGRRADVENTLGSGDGWVVDAPQGNQASLKVELQDLRNRLTGLATSADLGTYNSDLTTLEADADDLFGRVIDVAGPESASKQLKTLGIVATKFDGLGKPNPCRAVHDRLTEEQANAKTTLSGRDLSNALASIGNEAYATWTAGWKVFREREKLARSIHGLDASIGKLPTSAGGPLELEAATLQSDLKSFFQRSDEDIAAIQSAVDGAQLNVDQLKSKVDGAIKLALDETKTKQTIVAELAEIKKAIDAMMDPTTKLGFQNDYNALVLERDGALLLTSVPNRKAKLFDIEKRAAEMVERAHKARFDEQLKETDGKQKIAELIKSFGETTADPEKQAVCKAAMTACFGVNMKVPEGMSFTRLPTLFDLFSMVRAEDLKGLKDIEYETDPDIDTSYHTSGKIVLNRIGHEGYEQAIERGKPETRLNYFNHTALHEIGHNADDANNVMGGREGVPDFGGWKTETIESVADAHYETSFKSFVGTGKASESDMKAMIIAALKNGSCPKPASATAKLGSLFAQWDAITTGNPGYAKMLKIRDADTSPWEAKVDCSDSRSYHEGYPGQWYSYAVGARTSSISDYMWRAPGEWFADQFSYYRMKKDKTPPTALQPYMTAG